MRIICIFLIMSGLTSCGNNRALKENKNNVMEDDPSTILRIISTNPSYIPDKEQEQQAKDFLTKMYPTNKIKSLYTDTIEFIDQGQNFDSILCPFCKRIIEAEYWQEAMEKADETYFTDLTFTTPCCNKKTSLNNLTYITAAGFARFVLSVDDPEKEIEESRLRDLQKILNTPLRAIYAHY